MDTEEFDEERYVEFIIDYGKRHQLLTRWDQTGVKKLQKKFNMKVVKRLQTKFKKLKIKAGCSGVTKDKMILDESSGLVEKQSKTEMDAKIDQPLLMPERKEYMIFLDGTHKGGYPGERVLESQARLSYHTKFLEKVFGSRASEMIIPCCGFNGALLTDEEFKQLEGMDGVVVKEPPPCLLFVSD